MATAQLPRESVPNRSAGSGLPEGGASAAPLDTMAAAGLRRSLERLAQRHNQHCLLRALVRTLAFGLAICAVLMLLYRLYLADVSAVTFAVILLACAFFGWRNGMLQRTSIFGAALDADRSLGIHERLSSAVAFAFPAEVRNVHRSFSGTSWQARLKDVVFPRLAVRMAVPTAPTELVPSLLADAAGRAANLDPKNVYPFKFGRAEKLFLVALIAFIGFALMPNLEWLRTAEQRALAGRLNRQGKALVAISKQVEAKKEIEKSPETQKLAEKLKALGQKMQRGRMTRREALVSLGQLRKDLEQTQRNQSNSGSSTDLNRLNEQMNQQSMESSAGQQFKKQIEKNDLEKAAQELEKLADKMDKGELSPEEREKAAKDLEKAAQALRQSGNDEAARKLEEAAKALREQSKQQSGKQGQKGPSGSQDGQKKQNQAGQQKGQDGEKKQQGQQSQSGQQGQQNKQGQGQNGRQNQQGQESQSGQSSRQNQQGSGQQSQSGSPGQSGQGQSKQGGQSGSMDGNAQSGSNALRNAARDLRASGGYGGNSQNLQDMLDKIREAESDTGQNSGGQSGEAKQGRLGKGGGECQGGNCDGQNQGTKLSPSNPTGNVGGGPGLGPRNQATSNKGGSGVSQLKGARSKDKRRWQDIWSDRLPETQKNLTRIRGKMGDHGEMEQLPTRSEAQGGPVKTPYYEVYESYKKDAEDAVARDAVPPAYKQPVRQYFDSLKPNSTKP